MLLNISLCAIWTVVVAKSAVSGDDWLVFSVLLVILVSVPIGGGSDARPLINIRF